MKAPSWIWEILLVVTILIILTFSMLPTVIPALTVPSDQHYVGAVGYSDDYFGYTSFIQEGIYGRWLMIKRSLPEPQGISTLHSFYVWWGKIGVVLHIDAPLTYHLGRIVFGVLLMFLTFRLFFVLFKEKGVAFWTTVLAFMASGIGYLTKIGDKWWFLGFIPFQFIEDVNQRVTTRPHYLFGACVFVYLITALITTTKPKNWKTKQFLLFFILSFLLSTTHLPSGLLLFLFSLVYCLFSTFSTFIKEKHVNIQIIVNVIRNSQFLNSQFISICLGSFIGLLASQLSMKAYPYVNLYPSVPKEVVTLPLFHPASFSYLDLSAIQNDVIAFGPVFWLSIVGTVIGFMSNKTSKAHIVMTLWLIVQLSLYFFLYPGFHVERVRFVQTLFFIPMAYGAMITLQAISNLVIQKISSLKPLSPLAPLSLLSLLLLILFIPQHLFSFQQNIYAYTDYKGYSIYIFPTKTQLSAYQWLDKSTPTESRVLAYYEASNLIPLYSHNYVWGNPQNWIEGPREEMVRGTERFYSQSMSDEEALAYLKEHEIDYVYNGYQEKIMGDISLYPFLKKIFENDAAAIYKIQAKYATQ